MLNKRHFGLLLLALAAFIFVAASCGSDDDAAVVTGDAPQIGDVEDGLPLADADSDAPVVSGACVPDEPECEDTLVEDPVVQDLPDTTDDDVGSEVTGDVASLGMTVDGGLTISEALVTDAAGIIAVHGHLFDDGTGLQLCDGLIGLGEKYGCDGESFAVSNLDPAQVPDIVYLEGTTYTESEITLFGTLNEGTFTVDPLVAG